MEYWFFPVIQHSITIKTAIVEQDPYEKGLRKILNFGHTIGHAVESFYLNQNGKNLLHGEAIAIGMICEAYISKVKLGLPQEELDEIQGHLLKVFGKVEIQHQDFETISKLTIQDKKNESGAIRAVLLKKIGVPKIDMPITEIETKRALEFYNSLDV